MDIKQRSKEIMEYFDSLTDEQFNALLVKAGIEECPYEDETEILSFSSRELGTIIYKTGQLYNLDMTYEIPVTCDAYDVRLAA